MTTAPTTMTYDDMYAIGDMDAIFKKVMKHCKLKIGSTRFAGMDSDDVVQETLVKVMKSISMYNSDQSRLSTYLDHIIDSKIKDMLRKAGRAKNLAVVNAADVSTAYGSETNANGDTEYGDGACNPDAFQLQSIESGYADTDFLIDIMNNAGLNDREKELFRLRMAGYEFQEIAGILGVHKSRISHMWAKVKEKYQTMQ
jgi:RNA polymerase sporulation-specific sigma factor